MLTLLSKLKIALLLQRPVPNVLPELRRRLVHPSIKVAAEAAQVLDADAPEGRNRGRCNLHLKRARP